MNNTTLIKLDIDGVLRDWEDALFSVYEKVYPTHRVIKPVTTWEIAPHFPDCPDISKFFKEEYAKKIYEDAFPYKGAVEFYVSLTTMFKNVWLVTSQYEYTTYPTIKWCEKWLPNFHNTPVVFSHEKGIVGTNLFTDRILIDDGSHNLKNEIEHGGFAIAFGKQYNWNAMHFANCLYVSDGMISQYDQILSYLMQRC